VLIHPERYFI
jgi:hypothetical protein